MAKQPTPPPAFPGDIVQITAPIRQGALVVVEQSRSWGLTGYIPVVRDWNADEPAVDYPVRLRHDEVVVVGAARVLTPALAKEREAALATARLLAEETSRAKSKGRGR